MELVHTEEREGFEIKLYLLEEDISIADFFDSSANDIAELERKVDNGFYLWFCAKVTASKADIELGEDYLGACLYASVQDFIKGGYYSDMADEAISEAKRKLKELCSE